MESMREGNCTSQANRVGDFFSKLTPSALADFSLMERRSSHAANAVLFTEGEPVKALLVILDGDVRLSVNSSEGKRLSLHIAKKGDIIGLSSTLSGRPYDVTAETLYASRIAAVERREFLNFLVKHPEAYTSVTEELGRHMTAANSQLRTLGLSSTAPEKLARLLLEWSDCSPTTGSGSRLRFSLSHGEIADFIGTSRETVSRTLSTLKHRHLVAFQGSMMTIPNRAALEDYAHV